MTGMKRVVCLAVFVTACSAQKTLPQGSAQENTNPEYTELRPVALVVLPVEAKSYEVKRTIRRTAYDDLFEKRYSPISLQKVDAHLDSGGNFDAQDVDWDASLKIKITRWRRVGGGSHYAADGSAHLIHRHSGEILWQLAFQDQIFESRQIQNESGQVYAARQLAKYIVLGTKNNPHLPPCPPPPE